MRLDNAVDLLVSTKVLAADADPLALEPVFLKEASVVLFLSCSGRGDLVSRVHASEHRQQGCRVRHCAAHWPGSVLTVRDRNNTRSRDKAERRFDADDAAG